MLVLDANLIKAFRGFSILANALNAETSLRRSSLPLLILCNEPSNIRGRGCPIDNPQNLLESQNLLREANAERDRDARDSHIFLRR